MRDEQAATVDNAHQVDVDHPLPVGQVAVEELAEVDNTGIVVEHVRCPQLGDHLFAEVPHCRFAADGHCVDVALHAKRVDFLRRIHSAPSCKSLAMMWAPSRVKQARTRGRYRRPRQ